MSERTDISFDAALMMALRADAQRELDSLPTPKQFEEIYPDTSQWDERMTEALKKKKHHPVLKRVLIAALTLVMLTVGALAVSADFRRAGAKYLSTKIVENMPYLYIYTGNGDELEEMIFESTEMLYELLEESFYPYDRMNEVILFENAHNEKSWREIFPDFLHTFLSRL